MKKAEFSVGAAPFFHDAKSSVSIVWFTSLSLFPALLWGMIAFGASSGIVVLCAVASALAAEFALGQALRKFTLYDGSAFLTGLLVGLSMPPKVPLFAPIVAAIFAIVVVKWTFGGLGANWMNPALGGIAFALVCWPESLQAWVMPRLVTGVEGVSGATPLGFVRSFVERSHASGAASLDILKQGGFVTSPFDRSVTSFFNSILSAFNVEMPVGYFDMVFGNRPGAIGEIAGVLILLGSVLLIARRIVRWEIPATIFASFALLVWVFDGLRFGLGLFSGDVIFAVFSGSFLLVALYMAGDPVTSPMYRPGLVIYGGAIGALMFALRFLGAMPEGSAFAVLALNCFVPLIDRIAGAKFARNRL